MTTVHGQQAVAEYHREMSELGHHGDHNMYLFHRDWHSQNSDPVPPLAPDRNWGMNLVFGTNFLQMHHEMVKAADSEPKQHMMHASLLSWYGSKGYTVPPEWDPAGKIPVILAYEPDPGVFPTEIRDAVVEAAHQSQQTPQDILRRSTDKPGFVLAKWFTRAGVAASEEGEPFTGARKLADFQNVNQLGCCLVFPHNQWHGAIGGAMRSTWTAIADPIFYFGVHWYIDRVFDEYKLLQAERSIRALDRATLAVTDTLPSAKIKLAKQFTEAHRRARAEAIALSQSLREPPRKQTALAPRRPRSRGATAAVTPAPKPVATFAGPSIPTLMAVPADDHDIQWLRQALQRAIELELFTIPPYLCAMWSIKSQSGPVYDRLRRIAVEEMFHLGLACNLLNAIGGSPQLNTDAAMPKYPRPLPGGVHPGLVVGLEKVSKQLVQDKFMEIEKPDWPSVVTLFAGESYATIGQFYAAVLAAFELLADSDIKNQKQVIYGSALFKIKEKADVHMAIKTIREQGEGTPQTPLNPGNKPAHYYQFGEIVHEKAAKLQDGQWKYTGTAVPFPTTDEIYDMAPIPDGGYAKSYDFDKAYTDLMTVLHEIWQTGNGNTLGSAVNDLMYGLTTQAQALMDQPLSMPGSGNYGPSFLRVV
jgi:hypothetical protein